ncbi:thiamine pyrophosphate-dependent enzyme [Herbiconiux sp. L3-i23]|uniref:thiamine pyrophosphate-dependent enzyme n=1 Tax=Herbiconiux sp. L3-i23 TaxID=2905871 RepID=UPI003531618B
MVNVARSGTSTDDIAGAKNTVRFLDADGRFAPTAPAERFAAELDRITESDKLEFYRDMAVVRRFDIEAGHLQRQGQLGLWVPSQGQEAAQVGSGRAARAQDTIFPSYREHAVARIRGVDLLDVLRLLRGVTHGGWNPAEVGNFRLYTLVIGSQTLHATGYAMGIRLDGAPTGDVSRDEAVVVYFGDGATSQGDTNEAMIWATSYQAPQVFFLQNNHWAISVPVTRQSRTPLVDRAAGFGMPAVQIDGNDVLASYAVTRTLLDDARGGAGPAFIEAMTYRIGAHTTSDDPTRYRGGDELALWESRDPITRYRKYLEGEGVGSEFFADVDTEAADFAADIRRRVLALPQPPAGLMFDHVYSEEHPVPDSQKEWLAAYEAGFEEVGS